MVFDQNNNGLPNANGKVLEGIQREYFTNDGVNKLVLSNKFIVFEINKYSSFEVHKQWFQSILLEFFQRNRVSANRTGIRYILEKHSIAGFCWKHFCRNVLDFKVNELM